MIKIPKLKRFDKVEIQFYDPSSDYGWMWEDSEIRGPQLCRALGYYLHHDKIKMSICTLVSNGGAQIADALTVPIGCLVCISVGKELKKK